MSSTNLFPSSYPEGTHLEIHLINSKLVINGVYNESDGASIKVTPVTGIQLTIPFSRIAGIINKDREPLEGSNGVT